MYAIVDIAGQQFKVKKDQKVYVHRLEAEEGSKVEFDKVLLVDNGSEVKVGVPTVEGMRVAAKVLSHLKGDKVIVFKKKRRKGYQKSNGHRQYLTQILVQGILAKGETVKETAEAAPKAKKTKKEDVEASAEVEKPKKAPAKKAKKTEE
jgi:large subunit ribosomal protein L21